MMSDGIYMDVDVFLAGVRLLWMCHVTVCLAWRQSESVSFVVLEIASY